MLDFKCVYSAEKRDFSWHSKISFCGLWPQLKGHITFDFLKTDVNSIIILQTWRSDALRLRPFDSILPDIINVMTRMCKDSTSHLIQLHNLCLYLRVNWWGLNDLHFKFIKGSLKMWKLQSSRFSSFNMDRCLPCIWRV